MSALEDRLRKPQHFIVDPAPRGVPYHGAAVGEPDFPATLTTKIESQ